MKIIKSSIFAGIILLLMSCGDPSAVNSERTIEHARTEIMLHVKLFDTNSQLNAFINKEYAGKTNDLTKSGFAMWYKDDPTGECTIYVVKGTSTSLQTDYGHEIMHCIYGSFHKEIK